MTLKLWQIQNAKAVFCVLFADEGNTMPRCQNPRCRTDYPPGTFKCINPSCQCLLPEAVVAGRYRIETPMGLVGMGAAYRVSDTFVMQRVARKVISTTATNRRTA